MKSDPLGERAIILAPWGRDAAVAALILREAGLATEVCRDLAGMVGALKVGAGFAMIAEEALRDQAYSRLARWIEDQPPWSDLPVVILAYRGEGLERNPAAERITQALGNVTFLERPFHPTTLVSMARTALRGRRRQYEAREQLEIIRSAEERFRTLAENIPTLCWMAAPDGSVVWYNSRWYEYTGRTAEEQAGWGWRSVHDPEVLPEVMERWEHSLQTGEPFEMTFPLRGADGVYRPFLTQVAPMRNERGQIVRWFGTNTNVTREQEDRERLRLMVNELNHRVKNTLATIQAITALTTRGERDPDKLRDALTTRILALSKAHDILTNEQWTGANLKEIAALTSAPYPPVDGRAQVTFEGPDIRLPPKTAIAVALAFHELATNAAKYGALSVATGLVRVVWTVEMKAKGHRLHIVWRETGGPPVKTPTRRGFGTRLITKGIARDLEGEVRLEYPPQGVVCTIDASIADEGEGQPLAVGPAGRGARRKEAAPRLRTPAARDDMGAVPGSPP
jgi:PAS domain S-box-containing protein